MHLHHLALTNFKRHATLSVNIDAPLTVIRGPNYVGKSSVVEGIMFALGGSTMVPGGRSVIVRTGAKECEARLLVTFDGAQFDITRTMKDASVENYENEVIATGHTGVNSWVEQKLGMPIKDFITLSLSRQSETASLMTLGASRLNQMIEQLSGADFIDRVARKSADKVKRAEGGLMSLQPFTELAPLQENINQQETNYKDADAKRVIAEDSINDIAAQAKETQQALTEARRNNNERAILVDRVQEQMNTAETIQGWIEAARAKRDAIVVTTVEDSELELTAINEIAAAHNLAAALLDDLKRKHAKETVWILGTGAKALEYFRTNSPLLAESERVYENTRAMLTEAEASLKQKKEALDAAKALVAKGACPTCKRPFDEEQHKHASDELAALQAAYDVATTDSTMWKVPMETAKAHAAKLKASMPTYDIEAQYVERSEAARGLDMEITAVQAEVASLEVNLATPERINELKAAIGAAHRSQEAMANAERDVVEKQASLAKQVEKLQAASEALTKLTEIPTAPLQEKADELTGKLALVTAEHQQLKMQAMGHKTALEQARKYYEQTKEMNEKRAALESKCALYGGLTKYLRNNKTNFMQDMWDSLMQITSEFTSNVTGGYIESISRSNEGDFTFVEEGTSKPILAASGGQKAIAGVGLRVALSSLLPGVTCPVLLDEPSSELNDELAAALAGALRAVDRQVVLVTHREGEAFLSENIITLER